MADEPTPNLNSRPTVDPDPTDSDSNRISSRLTGRPVFESTLLPARKRRRFSPWLVIPGLLALLIGLFCFLLYGPKPRRAVPTAGEVVYAAAPAGGGLPCLWALSAGSGGAPTRLTSGVDADTSPIFSADGNQIAFLSSRAGASNQISLMDADGKNSVQVTRGSAAKSLPQFAPGSNSLLGFLSGGSLAVINVGKGDASLLLPAPKSQSAHPNSADTTPTPDTASTVTDFAWQPSAADPADPGLVAVFESVRGQALAVLPTLGSAPRLTQNNQPDGPPLAAGDAVTPAWSPDGRKIAVALLHVAGLSNAQKASGLIVLDAQGNLLHDGSGNPMPPLFAVRDPALGPQNPLFSPDGSLLAFELWRQADLASRTRLGLFLMPAGGGKSTLIAKGDAGAAQFSPDGRQLYYLLRRPGGGHDLFRAEVAGGASLVRVSDGHADILSFALSPQAAKP
jgi:Tol biopolymer transport system component